MRTSGIDETSSLVEEPFRWSTKLTVFAIAFMLLTGFKSLEGSMIFTLDYNIYAGFNALALLSISIATNLVAASIAPLVAKLCDNLGRFKTILICIGFYVVAYCAFFAASNGVVFQVAASTYITADSVFNIIADILVADYIPLIYRTTFNSVVRFPTLLWAFVGPILAGMLSSWKMIFMISIPPLALSMILLLYSIQRLPSVEIQSHVGKSIWKSYNITGVLLLALGISLTFVPVNVLVSDSITSLQVLIPLCLGIVLIIGFIVYEVNFAEFPLFPGDIVSNRTIVCGFIVNAIIYGASNICFAHFQPLFQLTLGINATQAALLQVGYGVAFNVVGVPVGIALQYVGKYKNFMWVGYLFYITSFGLFLNTRGQTASTSFIVLVQVLAGIGSGMTIAPLLPALQGVAKKKDVAMVTTLVAFTTNVSGYGFSLFSNVFWNRYLPGQINSRPGGESIDALAIVRNFEMALRLPAEQLDVVRNAYHDTQRLTTIIGIVLLVIGLIPLYFMEQFDFRQAEEEDQKSE
jgi:MFS family permease